MAAASLSGIDARDIAAITAGAARCRTALRGARILVTGPTGWFGTWLLDGLLALDRAYRLGVRIVALSRDPAAFARRHPQLATDPAIEWMSGDVRDGSLAVPGRLTHVVHAATESSSTLSAESEPAMTTTIVDGTRNLLAIARATGARRFLYVSSGAVYGPQSPGIERIAESAPLVGQSAYALGKREAECLVLDAVGVECVIARCFAFVGPHMPFEAHFAIGNFVCDSIARRPIRVDGDGTTRRSYLYMSDLVVWLLALLVDGAAGRAYNVGSPHAITIAALAGRCASLAVCDREHPGDVQVTGRVLGGRDYVPDVALAMRELGLKVDVPLDEAIGRTLQWRRSTLSPSAGVGR